MPVMPARINLTDSGFSQVSRMTGVHSRQDMPVPEETGMVFRITMIHGLVVMDPDPASPSEEDLSSAEAEMIIRHRRCLQVHYGPAAPCGEPGLQELHTHDRPDRRRGRYRGTALQWTGAAGIVRIA